MSFGSPWRCSCCSRSLRWSPPYVLREQHARPLRGAMGGAGPASEPGRPFPRPAPAPAGRDPARRARCADRRRRPTARDRQRPARGGNRHARDGHLPLDGRQRHHANRLAAAETAASRLIDLVPKKFRIGVISFSTRAQVALAPTDDRPLAARALGTLRPGRGHRDRRRRPALRPARPQAAREDGSTRRPRCC